MDMQTFTWDTSRLNAAIRERLRFPGRTEAKVVNHAAYGVALRALRLTPFTPVSKIDTELNVDMQPGRSKTGRLLIGAKKRMGVSRAGTATTHTSVPLAALIINSSVVRPEAGPSPSAKRFNFLKNFRYARAHSPFRGVPRALGRAFMAAAVSRMIKARHSSSKFLASGWVGALKKLAGLVGQTPITDVQSGSASRRGDASPAKEGTWAVQATIGNYTGMSGLNAASFNQALHFHGGPALQQALNEEAADMMDYVRKQEEKHAAKFNAMAS